MMQKERFEWIHSWCDEADKDDLPRVLLVGDSITHGYQAIVREALRGKCYVDYVATSYAIDNKFYSLLVENFATNSRYAAIHFNHGLHGFHMSPRTYKSKVKKLLEKIGQNSKLILTESTAVFHEGNKRLKRDCMKRVKERNEIVAELVTEFDCGWDKLFDVSLDMPKEYRLDDGVHYTQKGYETLAKSVVKSIEEVL